MRAARDVCIALSIVLAAAASQAAQRTDMTRDYMPRRFHALATAIAQAAPELQVRAFVDTLAESHFKYVADSTRVIIEAHQDVFAPLLAESQHFPAHIDRELNAWLRPRATARTRDLMLEVLRDWVCTPEKLLAAQERRHPEESEDSAERRRWRRDVRRVTAAEVLSDWRDPQALPLIESRQDSIVRKAGAWESMPELAVRSWWYLRQACMRIRDPLASAIAVIDEDGRVAVLRGASAIASARYCEARHPDVAVSKEVAARLLELLPRSRAVSKVGRTPASSVVSGVYVDFAGGSMMRLRRSKGFQIEYSDNLRSTRPGIEFENPELRGLLIEIRDNAAEAWSTMASPGDGWRSETPN